MKKSSLNDKLNQETISDFVSPESFVNLDQKIQTQIINSVQDSKKQEAGLLGKFFGTKPVNIAMNIAFIICAILLLFVGIDFVRACIINQSFSIELFEKVLPVITLSLVYIFGKAFENNK